MKKIVLITLAFAALAACAPKEKTADQLNAEITKTRAKIGSLNAQLTDLETELQAMQIESTESGTKVEAMMPVPQSFATYISTSAMVEAVNAAMVSPEMNGRILNISVTEGQKVAKGQTLVTLDSEALENSLAEMDKGLELTKTLFEKQKELFDQGVGSEMQYLEVKNRYESLQKSRQSLLTTLSKTKVIAPFSGYVETIFLKEGEFATPGRQIIQLISLKELYINTELSESYIGSIHAGDTAWISFPNLPGLERTARIDQIGKVIDPASRTFSVRIKMTNENEQIKPNLLATLKIRDYQVENALVIPTILIRQDTKGNFIYIARPHDGDYIAKKTYVKTGRSDGSMTVVEEGLGQSALLITNGFNQIRDGVTVDIVN